MRRSIRYLVLVAGVVVLLLVLLPFLINVNRFRPVIEGKLSSTLGREVQIGKMALSIMSGSFSAEDLSVSDDPAFSKDPFLTARSLKVGVELTPLVFSKEVRITRIVIEQPEVILLRGDDGRWNFSSLASSGAATSAGSSGSAGAPGSDVMIKRLELVDGRLTVGSKDTRKQTVYDQVHLEADDVSLASQFQLMLSAALPGGGSLKLDGAAGPIERGDALLSPLEAKLSIDGLRLAETGFIDPASGIGGIMNFSGTVTSKGGQAHARGDVRLNRLQVVKGGTPAEVPVAVAFDSIYDLARQTSTLKLGTVRAGDAVLSLTGASRTVRDATHLDMTLSGQDVPVKDLQGLLPAAGVTLPKGASLDRGTMNIKLDIAGPTNRLITAGDIGVFEAELAGFDMGSKISALSAFSGLEGGGGKTVFEKLAANIRISPDGIQAADMEMIVPGIGDLRGSGTIAPDTAVNFRMIATLTSKGTIGGTIGRLTGRAGKDIRIPFLVRGYTSDPKFLPDAGGMVQEAIPTDLGSSLKGLISKPKK